MSAPVLPARLPLAALPTPLAFSEGLSERAGAEIWIKRDDLTGFAFAGNKARPLELIMADAIGRGADEVIASGGPGSNFCRGLAAACRVAELACTLVLYGHEPAVETPNLAAMRRFGACVAFTLDPDRSTTPEYAAAVADRRRRDGSHPYVVPRGGASPLGAAAYVLAADELAIQLAAAGVEPARIVVAVGSGGTIAGLLAGGLALTTTGAVVSRPMDETRANVIELAAAAAHLLDRGPPRLDRLELVDAREGGFGAATDSTRRAVDIARRAGGYLVDHTYSARSLATLLSVVRPGDAPSIWWHTGGAIGALAAVAGAP